VDETLPPDFAFQAWEHFSSTGGIDKNTMVTVVSWLLGFSGAIIGYIVTQKINPDRFVLRQPVATLFLAGLGIVTSFAAGFVALLYGGYANRNWGRAHEIARARGWHDLLSEKPSSLRHSRPISLAAIATRLAGPQDCAKKLAPVFLVFMGLAVTSVGFHLTCLLWAIVLLRS